MTFRTLEGDPASAAEAWAELMAEQPRFTFRAGGSFILDMPETPPAIWGRDNEVLWADGEALMIAGGQGLGKTTLGQQLALGRCGFSEYCETLGYPIAAGTGRVLYLAMDRPRQAARSFRRMVGEAWRDELDARLLVWQGPPLADMARHSTLITDMASEAGADTVIVDSLKDAALGLTDDLVAAGYNRARQHALSNGVQLLELHHSRKTTQGSQREHPSADAIYGSTWLTSGAGSILLLSGNPGDPIVDLHHVKQPMDEVGPLKVHHDHSEGRTTIWKSADLLALAKAPNGITAKGAASALFNVDEPDDSQVERARRKLKRLENANLLTVTQCGDRTTNTPTTWRAS